jgi:hypothetical protein
VGSVARVPASWNRRSSRRRPGSPGAATGSGGHGRPATATWSPTPAPEWEETDASGRTGQPPDGRAPDSGQRTAGRWMGGQRTADRRTSGRPSQVTGHRTAGQPDGETGWVDTAGWTHRRPTPWRACWQGRPRRRRSSARDRLDAPPGRRRLGEHQPGPLGSKDAGAPTLPPTGLATAATVSCRWYAAVQLAPWRTALLLRNGWCGRRAMGQRRMSESGSG